MTELDKNKQNINLRDIKSSYILEGVFSFLNENYKYSMIIYNKELQKRISVGIEDYKKLSGRYRLGEKNGKGIECLISTNRLIFEGEYRNGKRNGKGKEYNDKGQLIFEGEFSNGKKLNGTGKEYYDNGILRFEQEYINGK